MIIDSIVNGPHHCDIIVVVQNALTGMFCTMSLTVDLLLSVRNGLDVEGRISEKT